MPEVQVLSFIRGCHLTFVASTCALDNCECTLVKLPFPFLQQDHQSSVIEVHHRI